MARRPRLELPGVALHVIQRGNNRGPCFFDDRDRHLYLRLAAEAAVRHECAIHAYVLMSNHVHLLLTPTVVGSVAAMMQDLGRRYVRIFNDIHGRTGTLWEGRYKAGMVDSERYLMVCHRYIELNPVRAGLVAEAADYRWSSHRHYALGFPNPIITAHPLFEGLADDLATRRCAFRGLFRNAIEPSLLADIRKAVNQGRPLGTDAFLDYVEKALRRPVRPPKRGRPFTKTKAARPPAEPEC